MSQIIYSDGVDLTLDRVQGNVATDPPFSAAVVLRHINEAYADIYEVSGGGYLTSSHTTLWSSNSDQAIITGTASTSAIAKVITVWASANTTSVGEIVGDTPMDRVDPGTIHALRAASTGLGTYARPKCYAMVRKAMTAADTTTSRYDLLVYPLVASFFFPVFYRKEFIPMDGGASDVPDLNDIETRDMYLLAAARLAPLNGRAELVPSIVGDISMRTKELLDRRAKARQDADQD